MSKTATMRIVAQRIRAQSNTGLSECRTWRERDRDDRAGEPNPSQLLSGADQNPCEAEEAPRHV